jgi:hypothetical protein
MRPNAERAVHQCQCLACQTGTDPDLSQRHQQMNLFLSRLSEPQRRWYVGMLSRDPLEPTDTTLALMTGLDRKTIRRGRRELAQGLSDVPPARQRRTGGGRLRAEKKIPTS